MSNFWATYDSLWKTVIFPASFINSIVLIVLAVVLPKKLKPYVLPPFLATASVFIVLSIASIMRNRMCCRRRRHIHSSEGQGERDGEDESESEGGTEIHQAIPMALLSPLPPLWLPVSPPPWHVGRPRLVYIKGKGSQTLPKVSPAQEEGSSPGSGFFVDVEKGESNAAESLS